MVAGDVIQMAAYLRSGVFFFFCYFVSLAREAEKK